MSYLEITTDRSTREVMALAREGVFLNWSALKYGTRKSAEKRGQWSLLPPVDGGVFDAIEAAPAWAARFDLPDPKGRGGAHVDVQVFDEGSTRRVIIDCAGSLVYKGLAKKMAEGVAAAVQN